jgi:hypothetical protein
MGGEKYSYYEGPRELLVVSSRTRLLCSGCGEAKPLEAFARSRSTVDEFQWWCRECRREAQRVWRVGHRDAVEAYNAGRRVGLHEFVCSECGRSFTARNSNAILCGRAGCKDARFRRLHPEAYRERQRRKYARRKARAAEGES